MASISRNYDSGKDQASGGPDMRVQSRPVIITELLPQTDAVVAAWLPGTEGAGVTDALFGDFPFTGKLPYTWPRSVEQLPFDFENLTSDGPNAPLFLYNLDKD